MAEHVLIQISDVHLTAEGSLLPGVRPRDNLLAGLARLAEAHLKPDMVILTGDLADTGDATCYEDLAQIMDDSAALTGASVVYVPGNHDIHSEFRRVLLGWPPTSERSTKSTVR